LELLTGLPPFDDKRDGNDIVTYVEETVEDNDITSLLDSKAGYIDPTEATLVYELAQLCLEDKKRRPGSEQVVVKVKAIIAHTGHDRK
jgi:interleukin-1 receptor-associated kinase 4